MYFLCAMKYSFSFSIFKNLFKNSKTILSSQTMLKQAAMNLGHDLQFANLQFLSLTLERNFTSTANWHWSFQYCRASLIAQLVKNPPAMPETPVWLLDWEDSLEKRKATHSNILALRIPWTTVHVVAKSWTKLSDFHYCRIPMPHNIIRKVIGTLCICRIHFYSWWHVW